MVTISGEAFGMVFLGSGGGTLIIEHWNTGRKAIEVRSVVADALQARARVARSEGWMRDAGTLVHMAQLLREGKPVPEKFMVRVRDDIDAVWGQLVDD